MKNIRSNLRLVVLCFMLLLGTSMAAANTGGRLPNLYVVVDHITPEPVEPGQEVTAKLRVSNDGGATADAVSLSVKSEFPFYVKTKSSTLGETSSLCVGCSLESTFYLAVDPAAISGAYPLDLEIHTGDAVIMPSETLTIQVRGTPDLVMEAKPYPKPLEPNDHFDYALSLENIGTGTARNIKITSDSSSFVLLGSGIVTLDELHAGAHEELLLPFQISESLIPDTYTVPITLSFLDEQNTVYNTSQYLGFKILHRAELAIQSLKVDPPRPAAGEDIEIKLRIQNAGYGTAENVKVELNSALEGNKKTFLGKIESKDDSLAIFTLAAPDMEEAKVTATISYKDDLGTTEVVEDFAIPVEIGSGVGAFPVIVGLIVLLIFAYFAYRRFGKAKR
jgi:hypothetical protein